MRMLISKRFTVISGCAQGVDKIAAEIAREFGLEVIEMPADWKRHGKRAGFIRNEEMAQVGDGLLAIWDGKSNGTRHMINTMREMGKVARCINKPRHKEVEMIIVATHRQVWSSEMATINIARPSVLGNPFRMKSESERMEVISRYKQWLWQQMKAGNQKILEALREINDMEDQHGTVYLLCWCKPKPCHGDVIVRACAWLRSQRALRADLQPVGRHCAAR
jgi:hypothetical protein